MHCTSVWYCSCLHLQWRRSLLTAPHITLYAFAPHLTLLLLRHAAEFTRHVREQSPFDNEAAELLASCGVACTVAREEAAKWSHAFAGPPVELLEASAIASCRLHTLFGQRYVPFLGSIQLLDDDNLEVGGTTVCILSAFGLGRELSGYY